jgi:hypothetical protein
MKKVNFNNSKRQLSPQPSPNLRSKKAPKNESLNRFVNEVKSIYESNLLSEVNKINVRLDQIHWIISNVEEEREEAEDLKLKISTELKNLNSRYIEFLLKLRKITVDDMAEITNYMPNRAIIEKLIDKYLPVQDKSTVNIVCSCGYNIISDKIKLCPSCYNELKSGDTFTLNETPHKMSIDHKDTLEEAMACYQGTQNRTFSERFMNYLTKTMNERGIDPKNITRSTLRLIIKRGRFSEHFCDLNLLMHMFTGITLPNISHLQDRLRYRNKLMREVYIELHPDHKGKFLHGQFLLKVYLQMERYEYHKEDFSSELKMRDVTTRHNKEVREACKILKLRYPELNWEFNSTS